jgi:hypothetical protein
LIEVEPIEALIARDVAIQDPRPDAFTPLYDDSASQNGDGTMCERSRNDPVRFDAVDKTEL